MDASEPMMEDRLAPSELEAVRMELFVFALITAASEEDADAITRSAEEVAIMKVMSSRTRSPSPIEPQVICAGNVPCVVVANA
jgi:hypothetical protein